MAARIHDSVLQTLALIQRTPATRSGSRRWPAGRSATCAAGSTAAATGSAATLVDALADAAADVEDAHGVRIEVASAGDAPLDEPLSQLVLAAREALTNAAKHSGSDEIAVYSEVGRTEVACSSATAAPASTAPRSPPTGAASSSRSRRAWCARRPRDDHLGAR